MMPSPPTSEFVRACGIFQRLAYPNGNAPASKLPYFRLQATDALEPLLNPPVCERLTRLDGEAAVLRGYAFRLGSSTFPHVKLQMHWLEQAGHWLFAVDTHDAIHVPPDAPDHARFQTLRATNRQLKEQIERAWEEEGLLTFNARLRQELNAQASGGDFSRVAPAR